MRSSARFLSLFLLSAITGASATAVTYTVTNTSDSGAGSLRQAILNANGNAGADAIHFNITGSGVHTISLTSALPSITDPVTIDGYTQPGASANTNGPGLGLNGVLAIEIDGTGAGPSASCMTVAASNTTIRGLIVNRCGTYDLTISSGSNNKVEGCFLGSNASGTASFASKDFWAIAIVSSANDTIGGTTPAARNLIGGNVRGIEVGDGANTGLLIQGNLMGTNAAGSAALAAGFGGFGISLRFITGSTIGGTTPAARNVVSGYGGGIALGNDLGGGTATGNFVQGNYIGTDVTGTKVIGTGEYGVGAYNINNTIGGTAPGAGNVIAGGTSGILMSGGSGTVVQGNFIGTDPTGTLDLGNLGMGIEADVSNCVIGGVNPGEANVIAFSGGSGFGAGVGVNGQHVTIRGNLIYGTKSTSSGTYGLGIDLGDDGVTPNDACDADSGANGLQNFPIITSVTYGPTTTTVQGFLNSTASTIFDLDFYANPACASRPQEWVQGETYLGSKQVTTDGSCNVSFDIVLPIAVPAGSRVTATATDPSGNTSEFSQRIVFSVNPKAGDPAGGDSITLSGMFFQAPATVTVGGHPATNINVVNSSTITATTPALSPGTVSPIVVTTGGLTGTLLNAWVAFFADVPITNGFNYFINKLAAGSITAGCGSGNYCPTSPVTRAQMSVFLLRSKNGLCYFPPAATGTVFADVSATSFAAAYIEALAALGITGGCGGGNYCPTSPVTRAQMSVFLLRTQGGPTYVPPACTTATFGDVPCSNPFAKWIYELVRRGITAGCGGGNYCPNDSVTRGQMAVFLVTTFALP